MTSPIQRALQAMFDTPAYQGSFTTRSRSKWWDADPTIASEFAMNGPHIAEGGNVTPAQLNTEGFLVVDGGGLYWDKLSSDLIPDARILDYWEGFDKSSTSGIPDSLNTDQIATAAEILGYPGVVFKNIGESTDEGTKVSTQYYVADPRRRRSRFAKFEDSESEDILAPALLTLMGGGALGAGALAQQDPEQNA